MSDDLKSKLQYITGVDESLAETIVASGVSMVSLASCKDVNYIKFAYELDDALAARIRDAANKMVRAARERITDEDKDNVRKARISLVALTAIGLMPADVDKIICAEGDNWGLAYEGPNVLVNLFGISPDHAVAAIALARIIAFYSGEAEDLIECLGNIGV